MSTLTRENVRAFMNRDWALSRRTKDQAVGNHVRKHGATAAFALAQTLLDAVWPRVLDEAAQREQLAALVSLTGKLARAGAKRR